MKQPFRRLSRTLVLLAGLVIGLPEMVPTLYAQETPSAPLTTEQIQRIDAIFAEMDEPGRPGCALSVIRDGEVVYRQGYGEAQLEYAIPIEPDTIFHVASVSKQFTTFAVALLAADGKLSLDDDVRDHVHEVPDFGQRITLRHLIHHTSGIRDQWELFILAGGRMDDVISKSDILELVARQQELNFPPGDEFLYCNTGYTLLAVTVERVSGESFRDFCHERIFKPLGMTRTHFHDDHQHIVKGRAYSYRSAGDDGYQNAVLSYANAGATSLFTTVEDLAHWQHNFTTHEVGDDSVFDVMLTAGQLNHGDAIGYAGGLSLGSYRGLKTIGHGGADAGFRSQLLRFPSENLSIAVLGNFAEFGPYGEAQKVADIVLGDAFPEPKDDDSEDDKADEADSEAAKSSDDLPNPGPGAERYVGWYFDVATQAIYEVTLEDDGLYAKKTARKAARLRPVGEHRYASTDEKHPFEMTFHPAAESPRGRATVHVPGQSRRKLEAVAAKDPDADYPANLPGRYYSPELDVFYDVTADGKKLSLKRRRREGARLRERFHDGFTAGGNMIRLTRDADGRIDGFLISTGRVRNLRFHRAADPS